MFEYRDAAANDFKAIAGFPRNRKEAFFMYPRGVYPFSPEQLYEVSLTRFIPTVVLWEGEVVGYGNAYDLMEGESCWLGNIIVHSNCRGKGAGKTLIEVLLKRAKEELMIKEVRLVCHSANTEALLFYNKLGFKPFDIRSMRDDDNKEIAGILMKKHLGS